MTPSGEQEGPMILPSGTLCTTSPIVKRKKLSLKKLSKDKKKRLTVRVKVPRQYYQQVSL